MNKQLVSGIDEQRLEKLIQKIVNNVEQLEKRFEQLDMVVDQTSKFYKSNSALKYRTAYNDLKYNYGLIRKNILSYVDDLNKVKLKYRQFVSEAADVYNSIKVKNDILKYEGRE